MQTENEESSHLDDCWLLMNSWNTGQMQQPSLGMIYIYCTVNSEWLFYTFSQHACIFVHIHFTQISRPFPTMILSWSATRSITYNLTSGPFAHLNADLKKFNLSVFMFWSTDWNDWQGALFSQTLTERLNCAFGTEWNDTFNQKYLSLISFNVDFVSSNQIEKYWEGTPSSSALIWELYEGAQLSSVTKSMGQEGRDSEASLYSDCLISLSSVVCWAKWVWGKKNTKLLAGTDMHRLWMLRRNWQSH